MATPLDNSPIDALFALFPPKETNSIGAALVNTWCKIVEKQLPQSIPELNANGQGHTPTGSVNELFFKLWPNGAMTSEQNQVMNALGQSWWANYSTAFVLQAIYNIIPESQPIIQIAQVNSDLTSWNPALVGGALGSYLAEFQIAYASQITAVGDLAAAKTAYLGILTSHAWIAQRQAAFINGQWPNAGWELFHHAIKLLALQASNHDVTGALWSLENGGLSVPDNMKAENWLGFTEFLRDLPLIWSDIQADGATTGGDTVQGNEGFQMTSYSLNLANPPQPIYPEANGVARQFIQQTKYYLAPSSCFTPSTRVLLPNGGDQAIGELKPGDLVWTPQGPRKVRVAPRVFLNGRSLYRIDDGVFAFSDSHPFVDGNSPLASLAVHPQRAEAFCAGLAHHGLGLLAPGAFVSSVDRVGTKTPHRLGKIEGGASNEELLIDLILEQDEDGFPAFAVGDGGDSSFFLVRSETLRFERLPFGTTAGLAMLLGAHEPVEQVLSELRPEEAALIPLAVRLISNSILAQALRSVGSAQAEVSASGIDPLQSLDVVLDSCQLGDDGAYSWQMGALMEALVSELVSPLERLAASGWRAAPIDFEQEIENNNEKQRTYQSVLTLHSIVSTGGFPMEGDWKIEALIDGVSAGTTESLSGSETPCFRKLDWSVGGKIPVSGAAIGSVRVSLLLTGSGEQTLFGSARLPDQTPSGYYNSAILLRTIVSGAPLATVYFDLLLQEAGLGEEAFVTKPASWGDAEKQAFAERLGSTLAGHFSEAFPAAISFLRR